MHTFVYIYVSILTVLDSKGTMTRLERPGLRGALGATLWNLDSILQEIGDPLKNIYFCFIDYAKAFDCVDHNKLWKILKEVGIPDHLTCLLRNLYAGQEATVRTGHGTTDWFQIGKGVR